MKELIQEENLWSCRNILEIYTKLYKKDEEFQWVPYNFRRGKGVNNNEKNYYSFKVFLHFWLAKIARIIPHNQLLSTKFGRILQYVINDVNCAACQKTEQLTEKTWGQGWVVLIVTTKWRNISLISQGRSRQTIEHSKNSKKTTQQMTWAIWRIYAILSNPLSPKLANKQAIEDKLNINGSLF